jgi:uncharacterized protein
LEYLEKIMDIEIDRIPENGLEIDQEFEFFNMDLIEENGAFLKPVHSQCRITKIGDDVFIKGKITTSLKLHCSRCLSPFEFKVDSNFDLVFLPEELDIANENLNDDDLDKFFYYNRIIDVKEIILEQLNLTLPLRPLCSPDCQGICPVCGKKISSGECSCDTEKTDSRLEKLKIFLREKR